MYWRLCCLLAVALSIKDTHAKPLIADPTFSDIDLEAEDSQRAEVYAAASPLRIKRAPQFDGNDNAYSGVIGGGGGGGGDRCGNPNIFGISNAPAYDNYAYSPYSPQQNTYNNAFMFNNYDAYAQQQQQQPAAVFNHEHQRDESPPAVIKSHHHQSNTGTIVGHYHQSNTPLPPVVVPQQQYRPAPPATVVVGHMHQRDVPGLGFHGHYSFGYSPGPPFGGPPGFNRGPPHFGPPGRGPPGFRGSPGFDRSAPPQPPLSPPSQAPPPPNAPLPTQQTFSPIPSTTPTPKVENVTPTVSSTTSEPVYDIDVRFSN